MAHLYTPCAKICSNTIIATQFNVIVHVHTFYWLMFEVVIKMDANVYGGPCECAMRFYRHIFIISDVWDEASKNEMSLAI